MNKIKTEEKANFFVIKEKLPSLNEYVRKCRESKFSGAAFKSDIESNISYFIIKGVQKGTLRPVGETPCIVKLDFYEKTKKRDVDNIQSSAKFILDALVKNHIIADDSQKYVTQVYSQVFQAAENCVKVELVELGIRYEELQE